MGNGRSRIRIRASGEAVRGAFPDGGMPSSQQFRRLEGGSDLRDLPQGSA